MTVITDVDFFDEVYLRTDPEQLARLIVEIQIMPAPPGFTIVYSLNCGIVLSRHYREEFTTEPNNVTKIIN